MDPTSRTAISIRKVEGSPGQVYYPLKRVKYTEFNPADDEVVVTLSAASLNHHDLFIRQHLYPGTTFGVPLFSDGCSIVTATGSYPQAQALLHKRVILNPGDGWTSAPEDPEDPAGYRILGGTKLNPRGTLAETICVKWDNIEEAPDHLDDTEAAALPLTGLTAWRALFTKSKAAVSGHNVLITGIGGGVALMALQFGSALNINVYVSSGSQDKIDKAKQMGARGGVIYKKQGWEKELLSMLPSDRTLFDAVIDGAGGDIVTKGTRLLKPGGVIVSYGMTTGPTVSYSMSAVLKNIELHGSTMGSRKEFHDMVQFVKEKEIHPIISRVVEGIHDLEAIDSLFDDMKRGVQFGKIVISLNPSRHLGATSGKRLDGNL